MRSLAFKKSHLPLVGIILVIAASLVYLGLQLRTNPVDEAIKSDRILDILVILEEKGKPVSTELFFYYPATGKGAVLDLPGDLGLIIKSVNKVDRIDSVYQPGHPQAYVAELSRLLATEIPLWLVLDEKGLGRVCDLLEGVEIFLPGAVDSPGPPRVLLPSGATTLDGDKLVQYAGWAPADEDDAVAAARRQRLYQSLVRKIGGRSEWLTRPDVFPTFRDCVGTNLGNEGLRKFVREISRIDIDHLVMQRVTGTRRAVDQNILLFPHYDGDLVRDIVKQTLNALASSTGALADKIFTLEILNGTPLKGLANRTAEIFQSFGYDVVSVGNADREDYPKTEILYRSVGREAAAGLGAVIQCGNVAPDPGATPRSDADFTIILGSDFNGRYVNGN